MDTCEVQDRFMVRVMDDFPDAHGPVYRIEAAICPRTSESVKRTVTTSESFFLAVFR